MRPRAFTRFGDKTFWRLVNRGPKVHRYKHYIDVIMTTMASQITSLTVVYLAVYSDADQRKHQSSASLAFVWGNHQDRWIPRTKGQLRGKCFHLMTSSWGTETILSSFASSFDYNIYMHDDFVNGETVSFQQEHVTYTRRLESRTKMLE